MRGRHEDEDGGRVDNEIIGGTFSGPVSQTGNVGGDFTVNWQVPPRSPEEAAFRAEYMAHVRQQIAAEAEQVRKRKVASSFRVAAAVMVLAVVLSIGAVNPTGGIIAAFVAILVFSGLWSTRKK